MASSPTTCCGFPSSTGPAQQPRGGQGDTCWVSVHRKATRFMPLVTVNPDSCRVCYKQTSHFFRPPALSTPQKTDIFLQRTAVWTRVREGKGAGLNWELGTDTYTAPGVKRIAKNGNPLQCSWLENPRDGGTWWAARLWGHTGSDTTEAMQQQQQQRKLAVITRSSARCSVVT